MIFKNNAPYATRFDDIYFDAFNPLFERQEVYIDAFKYFENFENIVVGEAGFGTGLNFFLSAQKALQNGFNLHYISAEKYPLNTNELKSIYELKQFLSLKNELKTIFDDFFEQYEIIQNELVRLKFYLNNKCEIILDIYFGDILEFLDETFFRANIWFLDGFSPAKNPQMWNKRFLERLSEFSFDACVVRSFSCARVLKDGLKSAGFTHFKLKGSGKKREFSHAICNKAKPRKISKNIWFSPEIYTQNFNIINEILTSNTCFKNALKDKKAVIIGAGIAGIITAYKLELLGISCKILERCKNLKNGASSNESGILAPLITKKDVLLGRFSLLSSLLAYNFYKSDKNFLNFIDFSKAEHYATNDLQKIRFKDANSELLNYNENALPYPKTLIKKGAQIEVFSLRENLAKFINISFSSEFIDAKFNEKKDSYLINYKKTNILMQENADIIIFAGGADGIKTLKNYDENLLLSKVRGQSTIIAPLLDLAMPFSARGYACKARLKRQTIGSSFDRANTSLKILDSDNTKNIENLSEFIDIKKAKILSANAGLRAYSGDRFAIIGQMHDINAYKQDYKALLWSKNKKEQKNPKYHKNIFVNSAHGAHGLASAVLGAELICDLLLHRQPCLRASILNEIHPARFTIRKLKKGLK